MHYIFLILFFSIFYSSSHASEMQVKLNGKLDFQSIIYHHDSPNTPLSPLRENMAFNNSANIIANASNKTDCGMVYGAMINLKTTNRNSRATSSGIYLTTNYGKYEFGSDKSALSKMKITSFSNAAATGGGVDSLINSDPKKTNTLYITGWANFLDAKTRPSGKSHNAEYARKITYYTPEIYGFQMGISYIPDSTNRGYKTVGENTEAEVKTNNQRYKIHFIDAIAGGISYKKQYSDDLSMRSSVVFEKAKTVSDKHNPTDIKFSNLKSYVVGSEVKYKQFSLAASFGDYLKSVTNKNINTLGRNTKLYGATARYNIDKLSMSIGQFRSTHYTNKFRSTTVAMDYKIAPGILPYAEITFYNTKGKNINDKTMNNHSTSGNILLLGAKFEF